MLSVLEDPRRTWDSQALDELSYTLLVHRQHFSHRSAVLVGSAAEAIERLRKIRNGEKAPLLFAGKVNTGFTAQPAIQQYATELLGRLSQQRRGDAQAYRQSLGAKAADAEYTRREDREFFIAFAQAFGMKMNETGLRAQLATDHAPENYRVNTVRNLDAWYDAFDVVPGQQLYVEPRARVRIW